MKKKWLGNRNYMSDSEMQGNVVWRDRPCVNPVGFSMYDGPMETV